MYLHTNSLTHTIILTANNKLLQVKWGAIISYVYNVGHNTAALWAEWVDV